ncbi:hypothetical protein ISS30_01520 [bacterium]|nr:hypothetical protein [bacterium]
MKQARTPLSFILIFILVIASYIGCARMEGERNVNKAPEVFFVNTPKDASLDTAASNWVYDMPFILFGHTDKALPLDPDSAFSLYDTPDTLVKFPALQVLDTTLYVTMEEAPTVVTDITGAVFTQAQDPAGPGDYYIDYTCGTILILDQVRMPDSMWVEINNPAAADTFLVNGDTAYYKIEIFIYFIDFKLNTPNFYVFSYAPQVHWYGTDPDGFVEGYYYADIKITPDMTNFNPNTYIVPDDQWVFTHMTSTVISLLSEEGDTTEHVIYIKCIDDQNLESSVKYRTFFRSNQAPNTPLIKWEEQPDTRYNVVNAIDSVLTIDSMIVAYDSLVIDSSVTPWDTTFYGPIYRYLVDAVRYDTLFCLENVTPNWLGIKIRWKGDDPDDKELYTIPLEFTYTLEKIDSLEFEGSVFDPNDLVFTQDGAYTLELPVFSTRTSSDTSWSDTKNITFDSLETGNYRFSVWSRDDGLEPSKCPAVIYFYCIKPTFENAIILYDETKETGGAMQYSNGAAIDSFYFNMLEKLQDDVNDSLQFYIWSDEFGYDFSDSTDVLYWHNPNFSSSQLIPYSLINKYRLIIHYSEDHKQQQASLAFVNNRDKLYSRYLDIGGRVWIIGRNLFYGSFRQTSTHPDSAQLFGVNNDLLEDYFKIDSRYVTIGFPYVTNPYEFTKADKAINAVDDLEIDTVKSNSLYPIAPRPAVIGGLPEVDWMGRSNDVTTLYYFYSITADTFNALRENDTAVVNYWKPITGWNGKNIPPLPLSNAPDGENCFITIKNNNLTGLSPIYDGYSVKNTSKETVTFNNTTFPGNPYGEVVSFEDDQLYVSYENISFEFDDDSVTVLDANDQNIFNQKLYTNPSISGCWLRTKRYEQQFASPSDIINVTRGDTAKSIVQTRDLYDVQITYDLNKIIQTNFVSVVTNTSPGWSSAYYFLPNPDSCIIRVKKFVFDYNALNLVNNTKGGVTASYSRELTRAAPFIYYQDIVVHTNGTTWASTDDISANYQYRLYWEKGDELQVIYTTNLYWENSDVILTAYTFNPVTNSHLKPVAIRYEDNPWNQQGYPMLYYRTSMFTFPLFFMDNTPADGQTLGPVDKTFRHMLIWFLYPYVHYGEL